MCPACFDFPPLRVGALNAVFIYSLNTTPGLCLLFANSGHEPTLKDIKQEQELILSVNKQKAYSYSIYNSESRSGAVSFSFFFTLLLFFGGGGTSLKEILARACTNEGREEKRGKEGG